MAVNTYQQQVEEPPRFSNFVRWAGREAVADFKVPVPDLPLRGVCRLRAVLVIAVYQAIIFVPLALFAGLICWGISVLAVPTEVAAEWIYGDKATTGRSPR